MTKGVPVGYKHRWRYRGIWKERKVKPGTWRFRYSASKTSNKSKQGGFPVGSRVKWKIHGFQQAVKVAPNRYRIVTTGKKTLVKAKRRG